MQIAGREYTVVRPRIKDPRFHLAAVIVSLHVLGQTVLSFEISIAQILISVGTAAMIGFCVTMVREHIIAWPASAVLAGNGVAFLLRVPGTAHGDWWNLRGWWIFSGTAALALASKYFIKWNGSHIFNPSNFGLVICFLALGSNRVEPLDFWWGPLSLRTGAAIAIISVGGIAILIRLKIAMIAVSFWCAFASSIGLLAIAGHQMTARWYLGPVEGWRFWWVVALSPETLVFLFFMITDPKTSPTGRVARCCYGISIGLLAGLFVAPQRTEFATKVAVLGALTVVCALRIFVERFLPTANTEDDQVVPFVLRNRRTNGNVSTRPLAIASIATVIVIAMVIGNNRVTATAPEPGATFASFVERPQIDPRVIVMPSVTINDSDRVASTISETEASTIARDAVDDLAIITTAQQRRDADLLSTASGEVILKRLRSEMENADDNTSIPIAQYAITHVTISLARRSGQGAPAIMVTLRGTATNASQRSTVVPAERRVHDTYEVKFIRGHYLLVTDNIPTGFTPP